VDFRYKFVRVLYHRISPGVEKVVQKICELVEEII